MRKKRAVGSGRSEDVTDQAGWMYADLFLALMVIFLATISFVPDISKLFPSGNSKTKEVAVTSVDFVKGAAFLYSQFDPAMMKADIEKYKKANFLTEKDGIIYVEIVGGYGSQTAKATEATVNAITFSVKMKSELPDYFARASFKIDTSKDLPAKAVSIRMTFAPYA